MGLHRPRLSVHSPTSPTSSGTRPARQSRSGASPHPGGSDRNPLVCSDRSQKAASSAAFRGSESIGSQGPGNRSGALVAPVYECDPPEQHQRFNQEESPFSPRCPGDEVWPVERCRPPFPGMKAQRSIHDNCLILLTDRSPHRLRQTNHTYSSLTSPKIHFYKGTETDREAGG